MNKIFFLMILIVSTLSLIGSCAKDDDDESTTAATSANLAGTGTTPSGTITGNDNLTGTFHTSWIGQEPSGGCVDNSSALSAHSYLASDTKSFKKMWIVTGSSSFTDSEVQYSDTDCTTMTAYFNKMADNVTIGSALTGLTAGSSPAFPTTANKMSYVVTKYSLMANTSGTISNFSTRFGQTMTSGEEKQIDESSPSTEYTIFAVGDTTCSTSQAKKCLYTNDSSAADNLTDWVSGNKNTWWQE